MNVEASWFPRGSATFNIVMPLVLQGLFALALEYFASRNGGQLPNF